MSLPHYCTNCYAVLVQGVCPDCSQHPTTTSGTTNQLPVETELVVASKPTATTVGAAQMTDASKIVRIFLHEFGSGPHNTAHIENAKRDYAIGICKVLNALPELLSELDEAKENVSALELDLKNSFARNVAHIEISLKKDVALATLTRQRDGLVKALEEISEYWNGATNERAMTDACEHVRVVADKALAAAKETP